MSFGFDLSAVKTGLPCRFGECSAQFQPSSSDSVSALEDACLKRDSHEIHVHGYQHRKVELPKWGYGLSNGKRK